MTEEPEYTSEIGDHWVSVLINEVRISNPSATDGVLAQLELLLNGQISERELTQMDLKTIAKQLIADMIPKPPEPEET